MTSDRESIRASFERMNQQQLALNGRMGYGLWQDMTPYLDDIADMMTQRQTPTFSADVASSLEAAWRYFQHKYGRGGAADDQRP